MARNKERVDLRNRKLYEAYKELHHKKRLRYDDVLNQLADQFFLSTETVNKIILKISRTNEF